MDTAPHASTRGNMQLDQQLPLQPGVRPPSPIQPCTARIPRGVSDSVPPELVWNGKCATIDQFTALCTAAYNLLIIKTITKNEDEKQFLQFKFLNDLQPDDLQTVRDCTPDLINIKNDMIGFYRLLQTLKKGIPNIQQQAILTIVSRFTNQNINDVLEGTCEKEGDDKLAPEYKYKLFMERFIPNALQSVLFIHKKSRLAFEFYYEVEHLKRDIGQLKDDYQLMLTSLQNRSSVNKLSHHVMSVKKEAMSKLVKYAKYWDRPSVDNMFTFQEATHIYEEFCYDDSEAEENGNFTSWITQKLYYSHLLHKEDIHPQSTNLFYGFTEEIDPILTGIRSFTPSPLELAQEKAAYMRSSVTRLRRDSEDYLKPGAEQTIGKAKSLLEQIGERSSPSSVTKTDRFLSMVKLQKSHR